jgi:DsbC/DsbD-like thiol-disulfide interchange protein
MQRLLLSVELAIESELHVYGQPIPDGYIPLSVEVAPLEVLEVGALEGPAPRSFRLEGLDEQFFVYKGQPRFHLPLTFLGRAGDLTIDLRVRWQACSATDCLPPAGVQLQLPVSSTNHVEADR